MKVFKHIVSWIVWSLLALYILTIIALRIPAFQQSMAHRVADALSSELGTKVSIGRIDLGFFNRIIIDDVLIWDQEQQEMLRAARLSTKIELLPLLEQRIALIADWLRSLL